MNMKWLNCCAIVVLLASVGNVRAAEAETRKRRVIGSACVVLGALNVGIVAASASGLAGYPVAGPEHTEGLYYSAAVLGGASLMSGLAGDANQLAASGVLSSLSLLFFADASTGTWPFYVGSLGISLQHSIATLMAGKRLFRSRC